MNQQPHPDDLPERRRGPVYTFEITEELSEVFRHISSYAGQALSAQDVADELGISRLEATRHLITLTRLRYVGTSQGNGRILYYWQEDEPS